MTSEGSDAIHIGGMLSYRALEKFAYRRQWDWFQKWIEPQWLAWLIEILKQSDDDADLFPHGKWATIQILQGKVAVAAAGERHSILTGATPTVTTSEGKSALEPDVLCGQPERDKRMLELCMDTSLVYYGPYPCPDCGKQICRLAEVQGGERFDYPAGPIYPNVNWTMHNCPITQCPRCEGTGKYNGKE